MYKLWEIKKIQFETRNVSHDCKRICKEGWELLTHFSNTAVTSRDKRMNNSDPKIWGWTNHFSFRYRQGCHGTNERLKPKPKVSRGELIIAVSCKEPVGFALVQRNEQIAPKIYSRLLQIERIVHERHITSVYQALVNLGTQYRQILKM